MVATHAYRLGLDLGTNSIGYALVMLDQHNNPFDVIHMGSRIFSDGREAKTGTSLAVDRRIARGMRRRRDRLVRRQELLIKSLIHLGFMPSDEEERKRLKVLDPYALRVTSLDKKLTPYEIGRTLFHLNQRRGFKSNRKHAAKENEAGAIKGATEKLKGLIGDGKQYRTYGEFLYHQSSKRIRNVSQDNNKILYDIYPERLMLEDEFEHIITCQQSYHPDLLTAENIELLKQIIFHQRPLKPVMKGRCSLISGQARAYAALPSSQYFRLLKEVNNLKTIDKLYRRNRDELSESQRKDVIKELLKKRKVSFDGIRRTLKLDASVVFNLETEQRDELLGASTHYSMMKAEYFGAEWANLTLIQQDEIIEKVLDDALSDAQVTAWLQQHHALNDTQIKNILDMSLENGTLRYSSEAIHRLIPHLEAGKKEYDAIIEEGFSYANFYTGETVDVLPYYGTLLEAHVAFGTGDERHSDEKRYGKIANPTVHIGLNQLRIIVNEIIKTYGHPKEIAVELSRDLSMNKKDKARYMKEMAQNTKENIVYDEQIKAVGLVPSAEYRLRLKLHKQQHGKCAYSGKTLSERDALTDVTEVDHILPFSRTFDDTNANKVLVLREYNRRKGNRSPHEAKDMFDAIGVDCVELSLTLPASKRWRFLPDAMQRYEGDYRDSGDAGWMARQLNDTSYMSRMAREYLRYVVGDRVKGYPAVDTYAGGITAKLRRAWGFNSLLPPAEDGKEKNRGDHRHHAIDALVIACANRSMMQRIQTASARNDVMNQEWLDNLVGTTPPYTNFQRAALQKKIDAIVVSHKPDHGTLGDGGSGGTTGQLHEDTFYGVAKNQFDLDEEKIRLVVRKPLVGLPEKSITKICDEDLRRRLAYAVDERASGMSAEQAIIKFAQDNGIRRVRVFEEKSRKAMKAIMDKEGKPYRYVATGSNHHIDIFCPIMDAELSDGRSFKKGQWYGETISTFDANQKGFMPEWQRGNPDIMRVTYEGKGKNKKIISETPWKGFPTAKLIMRLHINDMVALNNKDGKQEIWRVRMLDGFFNSPHLVPHLDVLDKHSLRHSANQLMLKNARKIAVTPAGKVLDPMHSPMSKPQQQYLHDEAKG